MSRGVRMAGFGVGGIVVILLMALGGVYGFSQSHFNETYSIDPSPLTVEDMAEGGDFLARGEHVVRTRGCMDCHGEDMGGYEMADDPVVGTLWGSNLTPGEGGVGDEYSETDWVRAIRHGVGPDGKPLLFMPAHEFWVMSDNDVAAVIAYLESLPPVDRVTPPTKAGPLARVLYLAGKMPLVPARLVQHDAPRPQTPPAGPTAEYGAYLASGCVGCHGDGMSGGPVPGAPPGFGVPSNLTPDVETGLGEWTQADFTRALREGISRDGRSLDPTMPVQYTKEFTDVELEAMWKYLQTLEPKPFGER